MAARRRAKNMAAKVKRSKPVVKLCANAGNEETAAPGGQLASQCSCGNVFMSDSLFCRKCGKNRASDQAGQDAAPHDHQAAQKAEDIKAVICQCGNIFMSDSIFCRKCGSRRPERTKKVKKTEPVAVSASTSAQQTEEDEDDIDPLWWIELGDQVWKAVATGLGTGLAIVAFANAIKAVRQFWEATASFGPGAADPAFHDFVITLQPVLGAGVVGLLLTAANSLGGLSGCDTKALREASLDDDKHDQLPPERPFRAVVRAAASALTLGSSNSLGPEAPAVEIGANVAYSFRKQEDHRWEAPTISGLAAGAAAGVAAGFNAPIAGLFFAVELIKPPNDNARALSMRVLAAGIAATVSNFQIFKGLPEIENYIIWQSGWPEIPIFLLEGAMIGCFAFLYKQLLEQSQRAMEGLQSIGMPKTALPLMGGLATMLCATWGSELILFNGFENVNKVVEGFDSATMAEYGKPMGEWIFIGTLKILATAVCAASGLVGGTFAPALFTGAILGGAFGQFTQWGWAASYLGFFNEPATALSDPTTYCLVGMACMLGAQCSVPISAIVLLIELTRGASYSVVLPLICGVGAAYEVANVLLPALNQGRPSKNDKDAFALRNLSDDPLLSFVFGDYKDKVASVNASDMQPLLKAAATMKDSALNRVVSLMSNKETQEAAFELFDLDGNGDVEVEEIFESAKIIEKYTVGEVTQEAVAIVSADRPMMDVIEKLTDSLRRLMANGDRTGQQIEAQMAGQCVVVTGLETVTGSVGVVGVSDLPADIRKAVVQAASNNIDIHDYNGEMRVLSKSSQITAKWFVRHVAGVSKSERLQDTLDLVLSGSRDVFIVTSGANGTGDVEGLVTVRNVRQLLETSAMATKTVDA
eukprot:TRINITY_DN24407_c0_g3_i1.p1 TRINITY_DN24407_c0_g3~~TRINITY_DN24407_c0_g3_i1.p1  ORF type:complete len:966 (+),score=224.46 TRINITY_DN24407_c0_g3_i1:288-2900(+)